MTLQLLIYLYFLLDANVPGSLGCPVLNQDNFNDFENTMTRIRSEGVNSLPLIIGYS